MDVLGRGIIQYVSSDFVIASKGRNLYLSSDGGKHWKKWSSLSVSLLNKCWSTNRWLSRLSRKEIHHLIKINKNYFACFGFGAIYLIQKKTGQVRKIGTIKGSRPLGVCSDGEQLYYGVYTGNKERKPISFYSYSLTNKQWSKIYTFTDIRHMHGVYWDKYESKLWITTGDLDHESTIWKLNELEVPKKVAAGSQQTRAVDLLFTKDAVFYATDAPNNPNYIYRLDRESGEVKKLQKVGGPVFYGRKTGGWLVFSTVVEPSEVNRTDAVELWGSNDEGNDWKKITEFEKDIGHMKLFQYGQIKFPNGPGGSENLWFTPYGTEGDHQIINMPLG